MKTREKSEQTEIYNIFPPLSSVTPEMKFDVAPFMDKPFFLQTLPWATTDSRFASLGASSIVLPSSAITSIVPLNNVMRAGAMFRTKFCVNLSLTGTVGHQGLLLAGIIPAQGTAFNPTTFFPGAINTLLSAPHAFLGANEASSVCIEAPFYVNADLVNNNLAFGPEASTPDLTQTGSGYSNLVIIVLNPLVAATGASTTLNVVVEVQFKEMELYVPRPSPATWLAQSSDVSTPSSSDVTMCDPSTTSKISCCASVLSCAIKIACCLGEFCSESGLGGVITRAADSLAGGAKQVAGDFIDTLRATFRSYTGLHNPNMAKLEDRKIITLRNYANTVDSGTCIEKLDPYTDFDRITQQPIFRTNIDEMAMSYILGKPQYLGTFSVNSTDSSGKLLWSRPISPFQGGCASSLKIANNIEAMYWMTRAWRGDMELIIQSSMTPKHSLKLKVIKYYLPSRLALVSYPSMFSITNALTDTLEFSQGNQTLSVDLPYLSRNQMLYNTKDMKCNALQHGMSYIYLLQPLVLTDNVSTSVEFNVYMRCKPNFSFYGYSTDPVTLSSGFSSSLVSSDQSNLTDFEKIKVYTELDIPKPPTKPEVNPPNTQTKPPTETSSTNLVTPVFPKKKKKNSNLVEYVSESAEVMNTPSSQTDILEPIKTTQTNLINERMIPLVDVRPLLRRFQWAQTKTYTATVAGSGTVEIPLQEIIGTITSTLARGSNAVIPQMFYGFNGGLKLKIKVKGSSSSSVRFIPPNMCCSSSGIEYKRTQPDTSQFGYWLEEDVAGTNPSVMSEMASASAISLDSTGSSAFSVTLHEVVIPNTSIYNFIGSTEFFRGVSAVGGAANSSGDLGFLYLDMNVPQGGTATITVFSAYTDETRFGFQVYAPVLNLPNTTVGTNK